MKMNSFSVIPGCAPLSRSEPRTRAVRVHTSNDHQYHYCTGRAHSSHGVESTLQSHALRDGITSALPSVLNCRCVELFRYVSSFHPPMILIVVRIPHFYAILCKNKLRGHILIAGRCPRAPSKLSIKELITRVYTHNRCRSSICLVIYLV